ncbi:MAG: bifunctional glutathionylspermidine amidase/synthase [Gammaproteobacteria bacterium]|nr:bifunctional glutathionylspermidine amidase/synthase [Gammaproteobacteria bacterium]
MSEPIAPPGPARFGTLLGIAPGGVPCYSSHYESADDAELPDRHSYRSYVDGIYMGYKWQCVEFARRWLYLNTGCIFDEVGMAYELFELTSLRDVRRGTRRPMRAFRNGSRRHPLPGCLLVWDEGGEFERTGHVAIVTEVLPDRVRFCEQNVDHLVWAPGQDYSREVRASVMPSGEFWLECSFGDATILGWVMQTDDDTDAEPVDEPDPGLFHLVAREVEDRGQASRAWLNVANPDEAAYVEMMRGHLMSGAGQDQHRFFCVSQTVHDELEKATNQLHVLFMHGTDYVLRDDALLAKFRIPRALWPKIRQSWANRHNQMITGRFDFALTARGLKVYEYNCDSASCHMECGKVQGKWADHFGCRLGDDPGAALHHDLREAWRKSEVDGLLHIMQDRDLEETYHALFMQEAMDEAGVPTKIIHGVQGLRWGADGAVLDADGEPIRWVWKTWAWETAIDQIRAECADDAQALENYRPGTRHDAPPRLVDVLLRSEVMVFEPLWTLIPSNKAMLPVLWSLFPNHPYLLETAFELGDGLRAAGYVAKPIVGRQGRNIRIVDGDAVLEATGGQFGDRDHVYQALARLPRLDGFNLQLCTFSVNGAWGGSCLRVDRSLIITGDSDVMPLRVVDDERFAMFGEAAPAAGRQG